MWCSQLLVSLCTVNVEWEKNIFEKTPKTRQIAHLKSFNELKHECLKANWYMIFSNEYHNIYLFHSLTFEWTLLSSSGADVAGVTIYGDFINPSVWLLVMCTLNSSCEHSIIFYGCFFCFTTSIWNEVFFSDYQIIKSKFSSFLPVWCHYFRDKGDEF